MAVRLALACQVGNPTISDAVWRRSASGMVREEIGCVEEDEEGMGRRLESGEESGRDIREEDALPNHHR